MEIYYFERFFLAKVFHDFRSEIPTPKKNEFKLIYSHTYAVTFLLHSFIFYFHNLRDEDFMLLYFFDF